MYTDSVCGTSTDTSHDGDQNVLLDGERAGIESDAEDLNSGNDTGPETEDREGDQLSHYGANGDRRIAEEEELVETGDENSPEDTDEPSSEGVYGHIWVIGVCDGRPDLGVGRILFETPRMGQVEVGVVEVGDIDYGHWRGV
jgi:hypothetical protein